MDMLLQLVIPGLVLPLLLSGIVWWSSYYYPAAKWGIAIIWLPSYVWLAGWPPLFPVEAHHWLWLLLLASILLSILFSRPARSAAKSVSKYFGLTQSVLLACILVVIARPVLVYQFNLQLLVEIASVAVTGFVLFGGRVKKKALTPVLSLAVSSAGLALAVALAGSLLIGQLAGALAAALGAFALYEMVRKFLQPAISVFMLAPVIQLYLAMLLIARIFAELPLLPAILLLFAPLAGLLPASRYGFVYSAISVIAAISSVLLMTSGPSY